MAASTVSSTGSVDRPACFRAGSAGFTVLLVGGALTGIITRFVPMAAVWWLPVVAVAGYLVAGSRIGHAQRPPVHGMLAALVAWGLMLFGRIPFGFAGYTVGWTLLEALPAAGLGAVAGGLAGRRRARLAERRARWEAELRGRQEAEKAERRARRRAVRRAKGER